MGTSKTYPIAYTDYIMCTKVYRCSPAEYDKLDLKVVDLHRQFMNIERKADGVKAFRAEQEA